MSTSPKYRTYNKRAYLQRTFISVSRYYVKVIKIRQDFPKLWPQNVLPPFHGSQCIRLGLFTLKVEHEERWIGGERERKKEKREKFEEDR